MKQIPGGKLKAGSSSVMNMNQKYPAFFESRDGLQRSYIFIKSMAGSSEYSDNPNPQVQLKVPDSMKGAFGCSSFNMLGLVFLESSS
ncbi:hypothetical protein RHGRI_030526 [Rhododendron griersonianum]|uniref:Uncharacterized protein n=1 Tax=Rhododendron griersonianum TaxID=479676 RepID=A0AAV6ISG5_9ERIC|nr:hypothetical protein RHGRI_030526 [Rhododendron griersonianum]